MKTTVISIFHEKYFMNKVNLYSSYPAVCLYLFIHFCKLMLQNALLLLGCMIIIKGKRPILKLKVSLSTDFIAEITMERIKPRKVNTWVNSLDPI